MSKGFLSDVLKYLPAQLAPGFVGLVSIPVVTHVFPPAAYGDYNLAMATVAVLSTLFGWLPTAVIRYYPAYARQGQLHAFNATVVSVGAIALALLVAVYYVPLLALKPWMPGSLWSLLIIGGLLFASTCVFNLLQYILRSRLLVGRYSAFTVWQSVSGFGLSVAFIFLLGLGIESMLLGTALSIILILPMMWRQSVDRGTPIRLRSIDPQATKAMFAYGLPLAVGNLASWVLALSDRYILGWLRDSSDVGVYSLSHNLADRSLMLLTMLFMMASGPRGMHIWENEGEWAGAQFVTHVTRFYLLLCVPATVGLSVLSKLLVDLLAGTDYGGGYRIMPWVLFGILLLGLQQRYQSGLLFRRRTGLITLATVIAGVLNVGLNILFVPRYGYFAAGVTTPVSYAVLLLLTARFARPLLAWQFPWRSLLNTVLASGIMGLALYAVTHVTAFTPVAVLVISVVAGAAIYGGVLVLLGEFSPQEMAAIRRAARRAIPLKSGAPEAAQPSSTTDSGTGHAMTDKKLVLLLGFPEDDTRMACVRWRRFKRHLSRDGFSVDWTTVKLPFSDDSCGPVSKAFSEFRVLRHARTLARHLAQDQDSRPRTTVLASIPTLDPLYVGAMLKKRFPSRIELVLEIRDVYARPEFFEYRNLRKRLEVFKESMFIRHADRVIYLTEEIKRRYCAYYPGLPNVQAGVVITNGYDPEEYDHGLPPEANHGPVEIGYFGSFYGSRSPELLLQTLGRIRSANPRDTAGVRIHIWGEAGDYPLPQKIAQYELQDTIVYHGVSPHETIMKEYSRTGVNLIITHTQGSSYALPGKLFEYIGARRPVWAITDDRILRDVITRHHLGYISSHDTRSVEETLLAILRDYADAGKLPEVDPPAQYEIRSLTRQLEEFISQ